MDRETTSIWNRRTLFPALIRKCVEARESGASFIEAWGTGNASREFLYVEDCAEGVVSAAAKYDESEPVNIGTGNEIKISELLQLIARLTRFEGEIRWQSDKPDGQPRRRLDVSRALEKFGFQAQGVARRRPAPDDRMVRSATERRVGVNWRSQLTSQGDDVIRSVPQRGSAWVISLPIVDFRLPIGQSRQLLIGNRQSALGNRQSQNSCATALRYDLINPRSKPNRQQFSVISNQK